MPGHGFKRRPSTSTSIGTRDVRPRINAEVWNLVEDEARRRGLAPGGLLDFLLRGLEKGGRRGAGARSLQLKAIEVLMEQVTRNLIRFEGAIQDFIERPSPNAGPAVADVEDHWDALARTVLKAVASLRSDLSGLCPNKPLVDAGQSEGGLN